MTKKQVNTALAKPLALTAGIIGVMEGLIWAIFSILSLCCYTGAILVDENLNNNDIDYIEHIYKIFLNPDYKADTNLKIQPQEFYIFMWFYAIFSLFWFFISGTVIWAMIHNQWDLVKYILGSWSIITVLISIVDVVLLSLIAVDYNRGLETMVLTTDLVAYGIVMTLVARGYILWIINITFAIIMAIFVFKAVQEESNDTTRPIINGYNTDNSNLPWFGGINNDMIRVSPKNQQTYENHGFERSQSFFNADITPTPTRENYYVDLYNPSYNTNKNVSNMNPEDVIETSFAAAIANRVATIGKSKGKSQLNPVAMPVIPPPDYTPPGTPTGLKPVLRSKSKY